MVNHMNMGRRNLCRRTALHRLDAFGPPVAAGKGGQSGCRVPARARPWWAWGGQRRAGGLPASGVPSAAAQAAGAILPFKCGMRIRFLFKDTGKKKR